MSYSDVKKFQKLAGKSFGSCDLSNKMRLKERAALIAEEFQELMSAMGFKSDVFPFVELDDWDDKFYSVTNTRESHIKKKNILKEACDLTITVEGTVIELGLPFDKARKLVDENNLTKVQNGVKFNSDGKIIKPKGYKKVDLKDLV